MCIKMFIWIVSCGIRILVNVSGSVECYFNVIKIWNQILFKWLKYFKMLFINYARFPLVFVAPENGQLRSERCWAIRLFKR
jgi:hypothetical protein